MDLRHLRNFVALAEELHFSRAAARLSMEQSPLSRSIKDLETDLKVRLFARTRRSTTLTPAGLAFLPAARRILTDAELSIRAMRAFPRGQPLRLGLAEGVAGAGFERLVRSIAAFEPPLELVLVERPLPELLALCASEALDGVLAPEEAATSELVSVPAWTEPLALITADADQPPTLEAWRNARWILLDAHALPSVSRQIGEILRMAGIPGHEPRIAATPASLARLAAAGVGVGLLPSGLAPATDGVTTRRLEPEANLSTWLTIRREDDTPAPSLLRRLVERAAQEPEA